MNELDNYFVLSQHQDQNSRHYEMDFQTGFHSIESARKVIEAHGTPNQVYVITSLHARVEVEVIRRIK